MTIDFITSQTGGAVGPDGSSNLNLIGSGHIHVDGDSGTNTQTVSLDADTIGVVAGPSINVTGSPVDLGGSVTISGITWQDAVMTASVSQGYFVTSSMTITLPASPSNGDVVEIVSDTTDPVVVSANTSQFIRIGSLISSSAGSFTNSSIGDSLSLVYRSGDATWFAQSVIGTWE